MSSAEPDERVPVPVALMRWQLLTFVHWAYDPAAVRPLVPPDLELDLYDGAAWVGLTPFRMTDFRPPGLPPVPRLSTFPETNLRTYVRAPDGRDGLWFLTLEAASPATVLGARVAYGVPYRLAAMRIDTGVDIRYRSRRRGSPDARADVTVSVGDRLEPGETTGFETYLTGRWRAYGRVAGRLVRAAVHHQPWPLWRARVTALDETLTRASGLPPPAADPVVHYSAGVDVRLGPPQPVAR